MEGPRSKNTNETPKKAKQKGNINQVPKPFPIVRSISNKETRGHLLEHPQVPKPFPIVRSIIK